MVMDEELERSLISRFQQGDETAFVELFEAHQQRVIHMALQVLRNQDSALDVSQEVFMRAYAELPNWRGEARFGTWLYRTALNVCFERIRAEEKQRKIREQPPQRENACPPEDTAENVEIMKAINNAVKALPPRQRAIFSLKQFDELRFSEIAALLEISEGGAKASYHKALIALKERLKQYSPEPARTITEETIESEGKPEI